ncbi:serine/threonine protein phosphatase PP1 isozyme, putative [Entamoeba invadens IP1]|uniref:serine/threonine protein phosphatase PP1 isozyme, putative n=1 Tax=Entamoeba invadens IP1 TaxID=370355 RepID=UPI0002C3CF2C|nr:serine/threonine protein phosphatase PP1 isozyme, putative [Entamoeba invadens IP1]ELP94110.1 serine/threonine protein phosphatase PP1 isozyme, putative [Entamoeba invadens IP1]|eukprot:XP_004260881.1 serine/threonine protein phosphatase PP1 isozyme, putative [Entamoeba invadens IP1]
MEEELTRARLEEIIKKCFKERTLAPVHEFVTATELTILCKMAIPIFSHETSLLFINAPLHVIGDLHGQFTDLLKFLDQTDIQTDKFLFLGDYVDRGPRSVDVVLLVFALKVLYPDRFFLLRGNHESENVNHLYGFYDECKRRFDVRVWRCFCEAFRYLPVSALIEGKILCLHGGLSKSMTDLSCLMQIVRPTNIPGEGLLCDVVWSDVSDEHMGWCDNARGTSYTFGRDVVEEFMKKNGIELLCRAHQMVDEGFSFCFDNKVLTLFSAPNYCNSFNNCGAMMNVDENLRCDFVRLRPDDADVD